jgi:hypothetical protein
MLAHVKRQVVRVLAWVLVAVVRSCATANVHSWD